MTDAKSLAALWASVPLIEALRVSGDGNWVYWSWSGLTENTEVWVAPTDGAAPPRRLTDSRDHAYVRGVSHDGSRAIFARSQDSCERDQLFLLTRDGQEVPLTHAQRDHYVYGGEFSPDGTKAIWIADFDYVTGRRTQGGWIWVQDLTTGAREVLHRMEGPFQSGASFSPDGRHILWSVMGQAAGSEQLWMMGADGSNPREVVRTSDTSPIVGDWLDENRIVFVGEGAGNDRVGVFDLRTGKTEIWVESPDFNPQNVIPGAGGECAVLAFIDSESLPQLLGADGHRPIPNLTGRGSVLPLGAHPDGSWVCEAYDAGAVHEIVRLRPDGTATRIAGADFAGRFIRPEKIEWQSVDGERIQGWLYLPHGAPRGHVTYVHGGPTWHSEDWVNAKIQFWLALGYCVLDPNYRGSTGRGMHWRNRVKEDGWGGREQADIRTGTEAVLARLGLPKSRCAIAGNSYGGFSSWTGITRHADLYAAAIPMCGMYRLEIDYAETEMPWGKSYSEEMMGGSPDEVPEKYANASPGQFADQIRGRVLVVHGLADTNVGPENTHAAVRELTALGKVPQVLLFPDEGHGVTRRGNLAQYLETTARFLAEAFGDA